MNLLTSIPARTMMSDSCRRTAFNYWLVGEAQPSVMISGSGSVDEAEETLRARFGDSFVRAEHIGTGSY